MGRRLWLIPGSYRPVNSLAPLTPSYAHCPTTPPVGRLWPRPAPRRGTYADTLTPRFQPRPSRPVLDADQERLAAALQERAERLRASSAEGLSVAQAVDLAAIQMGVAL